ncbi:uncharacterized protein LOC123525604 [Mercenaria mercenaria]|uniref:uncharacterized protein LOC123525604 n=1 Tax=Mercenaria mercenaria TaxID=6596 RepID=UPI00234ED3E0|nr:uncharacterized protein LOC123525604 [Mercenaria mercenaria]
MLGRCERIQPAEAPTVLDIKEPSWKKITNVVKITIQGLQEVSKAFTKRAALHRRRRTQDATGIKQFRTISLLSVEGKIFFSILAKRLTTYLLANNYVNTSVQMGGIPGFSGCVEHTSALLHEARINQRDLTVIWLDLANAYGSIPHRLIDAALTHSHIPEHVHKLVTNYLGNIQMKFSFNSFTASWIQLEKGIVTGCTISVVLFVMGMNMIIKAAERESRGPKTSSGIRLPSNRGFIVDMTVTTETHMQAMWILRALDETATWAQMTFKPKKSRCLAIKKGKVTDRFKLEIQGEEIPFLVNNPIKCLVKWFDSTLAKMGNQERLRKQVQDGLQKISKTELPWKFKAWMFQLGLLPTLVWSLMVYEVPISLIETLEQTVSKYLKRWLGLPPSFTNIGLYGKSTKLQLPLTALTEGYKVTKARLLLTLRDSADEKISKAGIDVRTG